MHGEGVLVDDLGQPAVRLVLDPHPTLFLYDLALGLQRGSIDAKTRHAVRLEPEHQRQIVGGHGFPEHRRVIVGVRVALPPDSRNHRRVLFGPHVFGAFEHHVLEEMGETGPAGALVLRSHVIPELQVRDGRRMILEQDHGQAVLERRDFVVQRRWAHGRAERIGPDSGEERHEGDEDHDAGIVSEPVGHFSDYVTPAEARRIAAHPV